jgi:hypothetical protein
MGGVDFSQAPKQNVSQAQFTSEHTYLPRTADVSVKAMTNDAENTGLLALGGNTARHQGGSGGQPPKPVPAPTAPVPAEPPVKVTAPAFTG